MKNYLSFLFLFFFISKSVYSYGCPSNKDTATIYIKCIDKDNGKIIKEKTTVVLRYMQDSVVHEQVIYFDNGNVNFKVVCGVKYFIEVGALLYMKERENFTVTKNRKYKIHLKKMPIKD